MYIHVHKSEKITFLISEREKKGRDVYMIKEKGMRYSTGVKNLDEALDGGLFAGENVVWEVETGTFSWEFISAFIKEGVMEGNSVIYFEFIYPPQAIMFRFQSLINQLPDGWEKKLLILDCFSEAGGQGELIFSDFYDKAPAWIKKVPSSRDPERFHHFFGRLEREFITSGTRLVFYSLSMMEHIWGEEAVKSFFSHVCPALYAYKTLAYWQLIKKAHPTEFIAKIEHTTQVVIDLSKEQNRMFLTVRKGGRRYLPSTYDRREYTANGLEISFK
jgi:KaiC/GvpD/RAD55 family RecA-like ATPase